MTDSENVNVRVSVTVRIPTPLRSFTDGADQVTVTAATVGEALIALGDAHPGILERVLAADGSLRQFVNLYLGADNVRQRQGLATPLPARRAATGGQRPLPAHRHAVQRHRRALRFDRPLANRLKMPRRPRAEGL